MKKKIFSGPCKIEIQGEYPINFLNLSHDCSEYRINGFEKKIVSVFDYRSLQEKTVTRYVYVEANRKNFIKRFCAPSFISVYFEPNRIIIEIRDLQDQTPSYCLWIAIGINEIPVYHYLILEKEILFDNQSEDEISLFSVINLNNSI
jgi:hypothetical protein